MFEPRTKRKEKMRCYRTKENYEKERDDEFTRNERVQKREKTNERGKRKRKWGKRENEMKREKERENERWKWERKENERKNERWEPRETRDMEMEEHNLHECSISIYIENESKPMKAYYRKAFMSLFVYI